MELCTTKSRMKGSHAAWGRLRVGRGVWDSLSLPLHLAGNLTCSKRVFKKKKKKKPSAALAIWRAEQPASSGAALATCPECSGGGGGAR